MVTRFYSRCWVLDKGGSEISTEKEFEVCSPACVFTQQLGVLQQLRLCTKSPGLGSCHFATFEHVTLFHVAIFSEFQFPYFSNGANGKLTSQRFFFQRLGKTDKNTFQIEKNYTNSSSCYYLQFSPDGYLRNVSPNYGTS